VPGFASLRCPVRFAVLVGFALAMLAAYGVAGADRVLQARGARAVRPLLAAVAVAVCASWMLFSPPTITAYRAPTRDDLSPAHRWLARNGGGGPLLELPVDSPMYLETSRAMLVSTYHGLPLVNGYTGYIPPGSTFLMLHAQQLPSPGSLQILVDCAGLEWILVHRATGVRRDAWRRLPGVRLVREFPPDPERRERDALYRVTLAPSGPCPGLLDPSVTTAGNAAPVVAEPRGALSVALPAALPPNREQSLTVSARNDGDEPWPATSVDAQKRFALAYSWRPAAGGAATPWRRVLLPRDVGPGDTIAFDAWIASPATPGRWVLHLRAGQGDEPDAPLLLEAPVDVVGGKGLAGRSAS